MWKKTLMCGIIAVLLPQAAWAAYPQDVISNQPVAQAGTVASTPVTPAPKPATPVVKPTAPVAKPVTPAPKPATPVVKPTAPVAKPAAPAVKPVAPSAPVAKPTVPAAKPVTPSTPIAKPATPVPKPVAPAAPAVKPATPAVKPVAPVAPVAKPVMPAPKSAAPAASAAKPTTPSVKPAAPTVKPVAPVVKPAAPVVKPTVPTVKAPAVTKKAPAKAVKTTKHKPTKTAPKKVRTIKSVYQEGDSGWKVSVAQHRLNLLGYTVDNSDGNFTKDMTKKLKKFQKKYKLKATGKLDQATYDALSEASFTKTGIQKIKANEILSTAARYKGVPYVFGGTTPRGFDCSGYVQYVFKQRGASLTRTADTQFLEGMALRKSQLKPGDLVFFSTYEAGASHVGIYAGNGQFWNATSSRGVMLCQLNDSYWGARYYGARRVLATNGSLRK
jgi:lipoprotein Spr